MLGSLDLNATLISSLRDPVDWVNGNAPAESPRSVVTAITHGDFHGDNLFTDGERLWVIDFERTGYGHILRDFCELEVDLVTRCLLPMELSQRDFYHLAIDLVNAFIDNPPASIYQPDEAKVLATAKKLRDQAFRLLDGISAREYCWALLFDALYVLTIITEDSRQHERQRAWILASLLCQRLQNWNQAIAPVELPSFPEELKVPTQNDTAKLKESINRHPSWRDNSSKQRRAFLRNAGLPSALVDNLEFNGTASDTEILVSALIERRGQPSSERIDQFINQMLEQSDHI